MLVRGSVFFIDRHFMSQGFLVEKEPDISSITGVLV
jgi:hypothetical protein